MTVVSTAVEPLQNVENWRRALLDLRTPCQVLRRGSGYELFSGPAVGPAACGTIPALGPEQLGDAGFRADHGLHYAYKAGAMAGGIASADLVIALGRAGLLGSFGAAGLVPARIEEAIRRIRHELPAGPYAFNLIHSPSEEELERRAVQLYLDHGVRTVEASAFLGLTVHIVRYRAAGLRAGAGGGVICDNRVIAKVSRPEVAEQFMRPAPPSLLSELVAAGLITSEQARLAAYVPMADDITVEADSGGHTDGRPLVSLLPSIIALRDRIQAELRFAKTIRVGAAGGISTPSSVLAAFTMGAAYVVTGSVNQSCVESGTSPHVRALLAEAGMPDVAMAPAADMFELGVNVQLLKRGTFFPMRAQRLYDIYQRYEGLEAIPPETRRELEQKVFRRSLDDVWRETVAYFAERDPDQIHRAEGNPKRRMALVFRWYLGQSSRWATSGSDDRKLDYQIWCGPSMGAFNDWARGSYLEHPENRTAPDVAEHLMTGAAYLARTQMLGYHGVNVPPELREYRPAGPIGRT